MDTTYNLKENLETGELEKVPAWRKISFQRLAAVAIGTGLVLSIIGAMVLSADLSKLKQQLPYIQDKIDRINVR